MTAADVIIVVLVLIILGVALVYIRKEKKQGKCIGCPHAKECAAAAAVRVIRGVVISFYFMRHE